jgi:hypothetical protein
MPAKGRPQIRERSEDMGGKLARPEPSAQALRSIGHAKHVDRAAFGPVPGLSRL